MSAARGDLHTAEDLAENDIVWVINKKAGQHYDWIGRVVALTCFDATVRFYDGSEQTFVGSWLRKVNAS